MVLDILLFFSMHNDQKWVRPISSLHEKHLQMFYQKLPLR
jgi:hypothetical protein